MRTNVSQEYCFGFELSDVFPGVKEINITYMFPQDTTLYTGSTYEPVYDPTAGIPNWAAWNSTFMYGTPQFMVYVSDLLLLLLGGHKMEDIELAFLPMKTPEFTQMEPLASS